MKEKPIEKVDKVYRPKFGFDAAEKHLLALYKTCIKNGISLYHAELSFDDDPNRQKYNITIVTDNGLAPELVIEFGTCECLQGAPDNAEWLE